MTSRGHLVADWTELVPLPASAAFDTAILIPAIVRPAMPSEDAASQPFWEAMVKAKRRVIIPAPVAAELYRRQTTSIIPRTPVVKVEPFDQLAADLLGRHFPPEVLTQSRTDLGVTLGYIKYDALIVACAMRHKASVLITTDVGQIKLAAKVGMETRPPSYYLGHTPKLISAT